MSTVHTGSGLDTAVLDAVRDLTLVLADSKRLLGVRYADWMLGAPDLEAGIACAAMAQDEWGHSRLLYSLLKPFDDVERLEHGRAPAEYRNMEALDRPAEDWPALIALNALVDPALTVQLEALRSSSYDPLARRVGKLLDEEAFHFAHGTAWFRRFAAATEDARAALIRAAESVLPHILRWFGPDSDRSRRLVESDAVDAAPDALRTRYLQRVEPLLDALGDDGAALRSTPPRLDGFDESRRRISTTGPDADTITRIRGDKNQAFRTSG